MLPEPLHAAVVHFPVVFAVILPAVALLSLIAIRRGGGPLRWWGGTTVLMAALAISAFAAVRTGEAEEERVERVVGEQPIERHEEAAERFLLLAGGLFLLGAAGLAPRRVGAAFRVAGAAGTLVIAAAVWQVGESGGELVYRHGAAAAYSELPSPRALPAARSAGDGRSDADHDDPPRD
jgi:uncharacterized membrane protein